MNEELTSLAEAMGISGNNLKSKYRSVYTFEIPIKVSLREHL